MNNSKKTKLLNNDNKRLLQTLEKKKECEKKALNIVIELIDGELKEDILLNKLHSINVCHYEDVVEERFILKQCGYVMCCRQLTCIPSQQYKIIQNKVYDITNRKKFCSNMCYKCSTYLQSQLLTSPLWLRDTEVVPKFKLLKTVTSSKNVLNTDDENSSSCKLIDKERKCNELLQDQLTELKI